MGKKQSIINFSRRIIHTNSIIFYTSFFHHRKDKQTPRIVQINPKKNAILWEGTEKAFAIATKEQLSLYMIKKNASNHRIKPPQITE